VRGRRYVSVIRKCLILAINEEDVFGFEVGMDKVKIVENCKNW